MNCEGEIYRMKDLQSCEATSTWTPERPLCGVIVVNPALYPETTYSVLLCGIVLPNFSTGGVHPVFPRERGLVRLYVGYPKFRGILLYKIDKR